METIKHINSTTHSTFKPDLSFKSITTISSLPTAPLVDSFDISGNKEIIEDVAIEELELEAKSLYSPNEYTDMDNIQINYFNTNLKHIRSILTPEEYRFYCKYIEGMTLEELKESNGQITYKFDPSFNEEYKEYQSLEELERSNKQPWVLEEGFYDSLNNRIDEINKKIASDKSINFNFVNELSLEMKSSIVTEIVENPSGYSASVLMVGNNYIITNTSTDEQDSKDLMCLASVLSKLLLGSSEWANILAVRLFDENGELGLNTDIYEQDNNYYLDLYKKQIEENKELIMKYVDKSKNEEKKVDLFGYSLGGGLQLSAYGSLDDEYLPYINSVSVLDPFMGLVEIYSDFELNGIRSLYDSAGIIVDGIVDTIMNPKRIQDTWQNTKSELHDTWNTIVDKLSKDEKVVIYSAEEDYVSTFYNYMDKMMDRYVFLKTKEPFKMFEGSGSPLESLIKTKFLGKHKIGDIDFSLFINGNIYDLGDYVNINDSLNKFGFNTESNKQGIDYSGIFSSLFGYGKSLLGDSILNKMPKNLEKSVLDYLENMNHFSYEEFTDAIQIGLKADVFDYIDKIDLSGIFDAASDHVTGIIDSDKTDSWLIKGVDSILDFAIDKAFDGVGWAITPLLNEGVQSLATSVVEYQDFFAETINNFFESKDAKKLIKQLIGNLLIDTKDSKKAVESNIEELRDLLYKYLNEENNKINSTEGFDPNAEIRHFVYDKVIKIVYDEYLCKIP